MRSTRHLGRGTAATSAALVAAVVAVVARPGAARGSAGLCVAGCAGGDFVAGSVAAAFATLRCPGAERLAVVALAHVDPATRTGRAGVASPAVKEHMVRAVDSLRAAGSRWVFGGIGPRAWWGLAVRRAGDTVAVVTADAQRSAVLARYALGPTDSVLVIALDDADGVRGPARVTGVARVAPVGIAGLNPFPNAGPDGPPVPSLRVPRATEVATLRRIAAAAPAAAEFLRGAP